MDFFVAAGTYTYDVSCSSGFIPNPSSGTVSVSVDGDNGVSEQFTANLGTLDVSVSGLPSTTSVEQSISGPNGYSDLVTLQGGQTQAITVTPGQYSIEPAVTSGYNAPSNYVATVNGGATTTVTVVYTPIAITTPTAPTIAKVNPSSGPTTGGTPITIIGTNFVNSATVSIGSGAATSVIESARPRSRLSRRLVLPEHKMFLLARTVILFL